MNQDIKKKWIDALKSGQYAQAKGTLRADDNSFCCLGVLCDIHARENAGAWGINQDFVVTDFSYIGEIANLPPEVSNWANYSLLDELEGISQFKLAEMNDEGKSFAEIAEIIEKEL